MMHSLFVFLGGRSVAVPVPLPPKQRSQVMSLMSMLESLNVQDDNTAASVMAEALNADQMIRHHMGQDIRFDVVSLRRVAASLAAHSVGLEQTIKGAAPTLPAATAHAAETTTMEEAPG